MNAEERKEFDLVQEITEIRLGEREGPVSERSVYLYINETPAVLSLLYDIGRLPEQLEEHSVEWCHMERIVCAWCLREIEIAEKGKAIRVAQRETIEKCIKVLIEPRSAIATEATAGEWSIIREMERKFSALIKQLEEE